ncbi:MAG: BMP family ABC transporter substrate-binding protein [Candidatus Auribacterota bacterium]|nr:BMP family ABC transporter substrate-binding protein [Candidatus Auribacterota bacterium]
MGDRTWYSPAIATDKTKVAVLFPGVVSDQSWNQFGYEGLMRIKNEGGVKMAYSENVSQDMQIEAFRNYAAEGYDVIIGMGDEYTDAAGTVAKEYPDIKFCIPNGLVGNGKNLSTFKVSYSQMGYLAGVLAGRISGTGGSSQDSRETLQPGKYIDTQENYYEQRTRLFGSGPYYHSGGRYHSI